MTLEQIFNVLNTLVLHDNDPASGRELIEEIRQSFDVFV